MSHSGTLTLVPAPPVLNNKVGAGVSGAGIGSGSMEDDSDGNDGGRLAANSNTDLRTLADLATMDDKGISVESGEVRNLTVTADGLASGSNSHDHIAKALDR